jgi:hypothetical protein
MQNCALYFGEFIIDPYQELRVQQSILSLVYFRLTTFLPYYTLKIFELGGFLTVHHLDVIHAGTADNSSTSKQTKSLP